MVRRSFSNPLLRVLFNRRRSKNDKDDDEISNRRKQSLDQTVLSGDDSRHFNRSEASYGFADSMDSGPPSSTQAAADPPASPLLRRASKSEPILRSHGPVDNVCQCAECISTHDHYVQTARAEIVNPNPSTAAAPPCAPHHCSPLAVANQQQYQEPPSFALDPALQGRIEALEIQQRLLGENHPDVIFALSSLAKLMQRRGDFQGALAIMRERSVRANTSAYEQQDNGRHHLENGFGGRFCVPSEISFLYENSRGR